MGGAAFLVAVSWFAIALKIILPHLNGVGFFRAEGNYWFSGLMPGHFDFSIIQKRLLNERLWSYFVALLGPTGWLGLLRPDVLILALPSFAINCVSGADYLCSVNYHYNNQTLPFLWISQAIGAVALCEAISSGSRIAWHAKRWILSCLILLAAASHHGSLAYWSGSALDVLRDIQLNQGSSAKVEFGKIFEVFAKFPDISISTEHNLVPNLANRSEIYMFPNPWVANNWGISDEFVGMPPMRPNLLILEAGKTSATLSRILESRDYPPLPLWKGNYWIVYQVNVPGRQGEVLGE